MAFTLAHCIVAIPLSKLFKHRMPFASLAIGSMTPDLYRLFSSQSGEISHQWSGLIYPNFFIGLFFYCIWYFIYKPTWLYFLEIKNNQEPMYSNYVQQFAFISLGLILGCITHFIWDGLTHTDYRTFIFHDILSQHIFIFQKHYAVHSMLQILSSLASLLFLAFFIYQYKISNLKFKKVKQQDRKMIMSIVFISILSGIFNAYLYIQNILPTAFEQHTYYFSGRIFNKFTVGMMVVSLVLCILFNFKTYKNATSHL
jgi:hypothetical protein